MLCANVLQCQPAVAAAIQLFEKFVQGNSFFFTQQQAFTDGDGIFYDF